MTVHERHPGRHHGQPGDARRARRARRPTTTTRTAGRWRSTRRSRCGSATSSTAAPPTRASSRGRPASQAKGEIRTQYHHADRPRPDGPGRARVSTPPETIKGHTQSHFDGVSMRYSFDDAAAPGARQTQFYSMLGSRGHLARRLEGGHHPPDDQRLGPFQRGRVGAVPHRRGPLRAAQPRGRTARQGPGDGEPLVRRGRRQRRLPARRPFAARRSSSRRDRSSSAPRSRYVVLPGACRGPGGAGGDRPRPLLRRSVRWSTSRRRARRACCSPRARGSAATPSTSRTTACTTSTASSGMFEQKVVATEDVPTGTDLILSASFDKDGDDAAPRRRPASCRCTTGTRRSARAGSRPSRAAT